MLDDATRALFDKAYTTDLVFESGCWTKCGDAHCCSFARHKEKFRMFAREPGQELPLLPGEWAYLREKGWDKQFGQHQVRTHSYSLEGYELGWTSMISQRPHCACDHGTRTVVCRLYPLLPVLDPSGRLLTTEPMGMYEELERLDRMAPACQVTSLGFDQLNVFLDLVNTLASHPVLRFYLMAYHHAKRHVFDRLAAAPGAASAFQKFETAMLRRRLMDHPGLAQGLVAMLEEISAQPGTDFKEQARRLHEADLEALPATAIAA